MARVPAAVWVEEIKANQLKFCKYHVTVPDNIKTLPVATHIQYSPVFFGHSSNLLTSVPDTKRLRVQKEELSAWRISTISWFSTERIIRSRQIDLASGFKDGTEKNTCQKRKNWRNAGKFSLKCKEWAPNVVHYNKCHRALPSSDGERLAWKPRRFAAITSHFFS